MKRSYLLPSLLIVLGTGWLITGCIVAPIPHPKGATAMSRAPVGNEKTASFRPAVTTREDVVLALGEPDFSWDGDRVLCYGWSTSMVNWVFVTCFASANYEQPENYFLLIEFDGAGRLKRFERAKAPGGKSGETYLRELRGRWTGTPASAPADGAATREVR